VPQPDYESPWKEVLERYFEAFLRFFFPAVHSGIDWSQGYAFMDKELEQIMADAEPGRPLVDKLARVTRSDGDEGLVLVHVEVQGIQDATFAERMYIYNFRLYDRYRKPVVNLAVLCDDRSRWRPDRYGYSLWGCEVGIRFPVVKLLDYIACWAILEASANPFAMVVIAHLRTQETAIDSERRYYWKLALIKRLYERRYPREDVLALFRFIDWIMKLPEDIEKRFSQALLDFEEDKDMRYITSVERFGIEKGIQQGIQMVRQEDWQDLLDGIALALELRFGEAGLTLLPEIREVKDVTVLRKILKNLKTVDSPANLRRIYHKNAAADRDER
jgi:hypothetical protein